MDFKDYYTKNVQKKEKTVLDLTKIEIEDLNELDPLIQNSTELIKEFNIKLNVFYLDEEENIIENNEEDFNFRILFDFTQDREVLNIILSCKSDIFFNFFHMLINKS